MITENERIKLEAQKEQNRVDYLRDVVRKAERYERLIEHPDFKAVMEDLAEAVNKIDAQLLATTYTKYATTDSFQRETMEYEIMDLSIRGNQLREYIARPGKIVRYASLCKEELSKIRRA